MKTIRYVVIAGDRNDHPQWVWRTKKDTPWGLATEGKWYDGLKIYRYGTEEDLEECRKIAKRLRGILERWEYIDGKPAVSHVVGNYYANTDRARKASRNPRRK